MFEAGEFAEEGVVAGVGIPSVLGEQAVEGAFRFHGGGIPVKDSGAREAGARDLDEAGLNGNAGIEAVGKPFANQRLPGKPGEEVVIGDGVCGVHLRVRRRKRRTGGRWQDRWPDNG